MSRIDPKQIPFFTLAGGETIPAIGMGTFGSDHYQPEQVSAAVYGAVQTGYRLFDCASVYGNEPQIGTALRRAISDGLARREDLFIMSKVWNDSHGEGDVTASLKKTLADLQIDALDAYFVHWPLPNYHAPGCDGDSRNPDSVPFSPERFLRTWREMESLRDAGLIRHLGMSNMTVKKLESVLPQVRVLPSLIEMELHPSFQQQTLFDYCAARGIQPIGYCPMGSPNRPERDKAEGDVVDFDLPQVRTVAEKHGVHPALICLKWAVQRGQIPIPFSVNADKYASNLRCITEDKLTEEEMALLRQAERHCRLVKGQVFLWPGAADWHEIWDGEE